MQFTLNIYYWSFVYFIYLVNIYRDALSLVYFTKLIIIIINSGYLFYSTERVGFYQFGFYSFY